MLRLLVLLLLLANGLFLAWSQGLMQAYGWAPATQTEPQRMTQQLHPERIRRLAPDELRRVDAASAQSSLPPPRLTECLQAGLYDASQAERLRQALTPALPAGSWVLEEGAEPERWIVYMGKYADAEALNKKLGELGGLNIRFEPLVDRALAPGLSLGVYATEAAASEALAQLTSRGVRTARVLRERAGLRGQWLKFPLADATLKQRLDSFRNELAGKPLRACR